MNRTPTRSVQYQITHCFTSNMVHKSHYRQLTTNNLCISVNIAFRMNTARKFSTISCLMFCLMLNVDYIVYILFVCWMRYAISQRLCCKFLVKSILRKRICEFMLQKHTHRLTPAINMKTHAALWHSSSNPFMISAIWYLLSSEDSWN